MISFLLKLCFLILVTFTYCNHNTLALSILSDSAITTINQGGIAIIPNFLSPSKVSRLRSDASNLYSDGHFIVDSLAGYGKQKAKDKSKFDVSKNRAVLPAYIPSKHKSGPFVSNSFGDVDARKELETLIAAVRSDLAIGLDRPGLNAVPSEYGGDNNEISYTRFGPGASLARHVDEHHEEVKGECSYHICFIK